MPILQDKKILLTGLLSNRSIAFGIGKALKREGATLAFTYAGEAMKSRVEKLAPELGGRAGPEPVRFGDWEKKGIAVDF